MHHKACRTITIFDRALSGIVFCGIGAIFVLTMAQVFFRYVLSYSLAWSEEIATYIMIWTSMVGLAAYLRHGRMIAFELLLDSTSGRVHNSILWFTRAATLTFFVLIIILGARMTFLPLTTGVSAAAEIPIQYVYASFVAGGLLLVLQSVRHWLDGNSRENQREMGREDDKDVANPEHSLPHPLSAPKDSTIL